MLKFNRRGQVSSETLKWIVYIALVIAVGFAVRLIVLNAKG